MKYPQISMLFFPTEKNSSLVKMILWTCEEKKKLCRQEEVVQIYT